MAAQFRDYYDILGVAKDADAAAVKKAFRKLARVYHPDVAKDKSTAEAKFKEINEAYEVLSDPEKRKKYDRLGESWDQPRSAAPRGGSMPGGADFEFGGTGFSDFFEQYFSGGGGRQSAGYGGGFPGGGSRRGQDIEGDLMVTLEESFSGSTRTISLRKKNPSTGAATTEEVKVRIPVGIIGGQKLRVAGYGSAGQGGGSSGDLFLRVRIAADLDYRAHGADLYRDLALAPWEAVLGATISIRVLGGKTVQLKVPAGTSGGDQLRLKGYGLPKPNAPGDVFVEISISVPEEISADDKKLWEKLAKTSSFKPREV